jgi:anti-sigma B factor antagonist
MSSDQREHLIVRNARASLAGDGPPPNRDDASRRRVLQRDSDASRSQAVHPPGGLAVEASRDGDAAVVVLAGEFDLATVESVREALTRAITEPRQRLIVDLSGVTFIDSSGLHAILETQKLCRDAGRTLTIRPGPPNVQQVFDLTNLLDYLPFQSSA